MTTRGRVQLERIGKSYGPVNVLRGVDLEIRPGEFFALLGPSGSGKTTTLRIIAGLEVATEGTILFDGADVTLASPGERDVAMVFQSYALYPHMSVAENIAFPLKMIRTPKAEIGKAVEEAAGRVKIGHLLDRRPGQLSGGQQQRVALARAIVRKPALFLLDEPLSNLDAKLRVETRVELKRLQRSLGVTTIYVTHDQEEALSLADRMAVFMDGALVQMGTPEDVYGRPASTRVAVFLGSPAMNLLTASLRDGTATIGDQSVTMTGLAAYGTREAVIGVRPTDIRLGGEGPGRATVVMRELLGEEAIVDLTFGGQSLRAKTPASVRFAEGESVPVRFEPAILHVFSADDGRRLEA